MSRHWPRDSTRRCVTQECPPPVRLISEFLTQSVFATEMAALFACRGVDQYLSGLSAQRKHRETATIFGATGANPNLSTFGSAPRPDIRTIHCVRRSGFTRASDIAVAIPTPRARDPSAPASPTHPLARRRARAHPAAAVWPVRVAGSARSRHRR